MDSVSAGRVVLGFLFAVRTIRHHGFEAARVWEAAAGRCTASVQNLGNAGTAAIAETRRLLGMVETGLQKNAKLREDIRLIVSTPPPTRPDGKPKDCSDAISEIRKTVQP